MHFAFFANSTITIRGVEDSSRYGRQMNFDDRK